MKARYALSAPLGAFLALFLAAGCGDGEPDRGPGANVILVTVDTLRADHLGCYGYNRPVSPAIDALAEKSILFDNAVTPRPLTGPALASLLTGLYPYRHGARGNRTPIGDVPTLPSVLRDHGYATAAFVSNWVLKPKFSGFDRHFDIYEHDLESPVPNRPRLAESIAPEVNGKAISWLEEKRESPFFLWVHYMDPHGPYLPPEGYRSRFTHEERDLRPYRYIRKYQRLPGAYREGDLTDVRDYTDQYDSEIAYTDTHVGALLEKVKELGLDENTLVIFTADHGESLTQHDYYFDHGKELYDDSCRIPLLVRLPGERKHVGRRIGSLVSIKDLFPTVLDFLGIEWEGLELDGISLLPLLAGGSKVRDDIFLEFHKKGVFKRVALRTESAKIIYLGKKAECYDLSEDPAELNPEGCGEGTRTDLERRLKKYVEAAGEPVSPSGKAPLDERDREALKSLGYIK